LTAIWAVVFVIYVQATNAGNSWVATLLYVLLVLTLAAGIPLACMAAVLKYRLYEIDRIISRTLAYAILTGLLVGIYAGLVLLATEVLAIKSPVAVAGSTLVAAALFSPLRSRVRRAVDRRFNRARYDADQMVMAFAARQPAHISVWISQRD
jgi:hypothetical protein